MATRSLNPTQRLEAFLVHCRLIAELNEAGRRAARVRAPAQS
jgi:hypothetical protein